MDTVLPQKFPFILDRNLAKANCTKNHVCTSCDTVVLGSCKFFIRSGAYFRKFISTYDHLYLILIGYNNLECKIELALVYGYTFVNKKKVDAANHMQKKEVL